MVATCCIPNMVSCTSSTCANGNVLIPNKTCREGFNCTDAVCCQPFCKANPDVCFVSIQNIGHCIFCSLMNIRINSMNLHCTLHTLSVQGTKCDDKVPLTSNDICKSGVCTGTPILSTCSEQVDCKFPQYKGSKSVRAGAVWIVFFFFFC